MRFDVLSLFPEIVSAYCNESILGMALERGLCEINLYNPRDFSHNKHKRVDDTPYGGGAGMLLSVQPFYDCLRSIIDLPLGPATSKSTELIIFSPRGEVLNQNLVAELAQKERLIMLCGRYEGFDERIYSLTTREVSLGDFILTGGELAAMTVIDSVARLLPSVLGSEQSHLADSFSKAEDLFNLKEFEFTKAEKAHLEVLLKKYGINSFEDFRALPFIEYPHYTRPRKFLEMEVPELLFSGDHKKILFWRIEQALKMTLKAKGLPTFLKASE